MVSSRCGVRGGRFDDEEEYKRLQIAEQRRRWKVCENTSLSIPTGAGIHGEDDADDAMVQVKYYTPSGKPDKKRPIGRPWDPSIFAGPEREIFCGGQWTFRDIPSSTRAARTRHTYRPSRRSISSVWYA
jgi:hypothetical protein